MLPFESAVSPVCRLVDALQVVLKEGALSLVTLVSVRFPNPS
jgi:hypothetical protein